MVLAVWCCGLRGADSRLTDSAEELAVKMAASTSRDSELRPRMDGFTSTLSEYSTALADMVSTQGLAPAHLPWRVRYDYFPRLQRSLSGAWGAGYTFPAVDQKAYYGS